MDVGTIEKIDIQQVWPSESRNFTPWLRNNISVLDKVLGLGMTNPRSEVGAGAFSIDIVAETDFGEIVIENQYGKSDHRHLGQLVTYLSHREVQRAIWIVEHGRPEHIKAVETLNERGLGQIWMVAVRAIRIGSSDPAPLFDVLTKPSEIEVDVEPLELKPSNIKKRHFMVSLFKQAHEEGIDSPFKNLKPGIHGLVHTPAHGPALLYRTAVNRKQSRVVLTNANGKWLGALAELQKNQSEIESKFHAAGLSGDLKWERIGVDRWVIRYTSDANYQEEINPVKMRELNRAAAEMKQIFDPYLEQLDPNLEGDSPSDTP